jgi:hypothetical protein
VLATIAAATHFGIRFSYIAPIDELFLSQFIVGRMQEWLVDSHQLTGASLNNLVDNCKQF